MPASRHPHPKTTYSHRVRASIPACALLLVTLAACAEAPTTEEPPSPVPTRAPTSTAVPEPTILPTATAQPTRDYSDVLSLPSQALDNPAGTFEIYLQDAITQQVSIQREKLDMRLRYQRPGALMQELPSLIVNIEMLENRSRRTVLRENSSAYEVEIDIRVSFADGDTSTMTCAWPVTLERSIDRWYVVNPTELLIFVNCA